LKRLPEALESLHTVDLAFLDGGAHPEVCLQEFELVLSKLSPCGLIVVDDAQNLPPSELYPLPRPFGKGTLILPFLVISEYVAERELYRDRNNQFAATDEGVPDSRILSHAGIDGIQHVIGGVTYAILAEGIHKMLVIGRREIVQSLLERGDF
jgi:hypothetical protein